MGLCFQCRENHFCREYYSVGIVLLRTKTRSRAVGGNRCGDEDSYLSIVGEAIEPAVAPLGYDWKMGVGIITSFAAREVLWGQWRFSMA
ncbi:hypothetical protein [Bergeyella porcorum]|uniref:hypothetical protein n=1 Tax=Bergeyella porcorum TaxID=1735111 RepID=UPI002E1F4A39